MADLDTPNSADVGGPAVGAFVAAGSATGTWQLDPAKSSVMFHSTSMWGLAKIHGTFGSVSGSGTVSPEGTVTGELVIDAASFDTKMGQRDKHLRSADFFDVDHHPTIVYSVEQVSTPEGNLLDVTGTLTVRGQTRPLPFTAKVTEATPETVTIEAELDVERSQFGMTWRPMKVASLHNRVVVTATFERAAAA